MFFNPNFGCSNTAPPDCCCGNMSGIGPFPYPSGCCAVPQGISESPNIPSPASSAGPQGPPGPAGPQGPAGPAGVTGPAAIVTAGTVTTGAPGTQAAVTNVGTAQAAILNFTIPAGPTGPQGPAGAAGATGATGAQGPVGPMGPAGPAGAPATITINPVVVGPAGSCPSVVNTGTDSAAVLTFTLPAAAAPAAPSALTAVNAAATCGTIGTALALAATQASAGTAVTHTPGSPDILLTAPGTYEISYNTTASIPTGTVPGTVSAYLANNGAVIPGTTVSSTVGTATAAAALTAATIVTVPGGTSSITLVPNSADTTFADTAVTVRRIS